MRNILLIIGEVIVCYIAIIILNKKYKTDGLYVYGIIATFLSCIMSLKKIDIFEISIPIGFGVTTSIILAGNIITQKKGMPAMKTYLSLILITALVSCCFLNLSGLMESSDYNKYANKSYDSIFEYNLRIYISNTVSLISSVWLSSKIYATIKRISNKIIISNTFSIVIVELVENLIFVLGAYLFEESAVNIIFCIMFRYMIKTIIGLLGTIPVYISGKGN